MAIEICAKCGNVCTHFVPMPGKPSKFICKDCERRGKA